MTLRESDLQEAIITWSHTIVETYPELKWLFHPANGGYRSGREALSLKRQGVVPGVLDLMLCVPRGGHHGLAIELKIPGSKCLPPSKEQAAYIAFLTEQGYCARISNDFQEVKTIILEYLNSGTNA